MTTILKRNKLTSKTEQLNILSSNLAAAQAEVESYLEKNGGTLKTVDNELSYLKLGIDQYFST